MIIKTNRIIELVSLLNKYRDAYYNDNESLVSDKEYDSINYDIQEIISILVAICKKTNI